MYGFSKEVAKLQREEWTDIEALSLDVHYGTQNIGERAKEVLGYEILADEMNTLLINAGRRAHYKKKLEDIHVRPYVAEQIKHLEWYMDAGRAVKPLLVLGTLSAAVGALALTIEGTSIVGWLSGATGALAYFLALIFGVGSGHEGSFAETPIKDFKKRLPPDIAALAVRVKEVLPECELLVRSLSSPETTQGFLVATVEDCRFTIAVWNKTTEDTPRR
jgi:hypothetical protein